MKKLLLLAACLTLLVIAAGEADAAKAPRPWREHLAKHMRVPEVNTPTEVRAVLDKRRDEIREGWEKWRSDYETHLEYLEYREEAAFPAPGATTTEQVESGLPVDIYCESGGNPQAVSPSGTYWGLYQFDYQTWVAHGGNPSSYGNASAAEQHAVASRVTYDAWPNC